MITLGTKDQPALEEKIRTKTARICVIGLGYVGLPLAMGFAKAGFCLVGIDDNPDKVSRVNQGIDYITGESEDLSSLIREGRLRATGDYSVISEVDIICICVPTPLTKNREPDISYVVSVTNHVAQFLRPGHLVILESTTFPGTTEEVMLPRLEATGLHVGKDFYLAFSPERIDPGNKEYGIYNAPKIVGGVTPTCTELADVLYAQIIEKVHQASSPKVAEMVKLLENVFRGVNIALVNELALLCKRMNISIWEVVELAATKPYGFMSFYPGPGLGGHCIPIDPFYLTWKAREYDFQTKFIELAGEINAYMPYHVVNMVIDALACHRKSLNGAKMLVLGAAYKKDIGDSRESPAIKIMEIMEKKGAEVSYNDDHVPSVKVSGVVRRSRPLENLGEYDCVIIATDHSYYDYEQIVRESNIVVDTRNATKAGDDKKIFVL